MPDIVQQHIRINLLDSLRGIAVLGILLMNIRAFGLPYEAVINPAVNADLSGADFYAWLLTEWMIDGIFRAILSLLFGAGMLLFLEKNKAGIFFRRQFVLLLFGLINAYLFLWFWDILFMYAVCGMLLYAARKFSPGKLFIAASICLLVTELIDNQDLYQSKLTIQRGEAALHSKNSGQEISLQEARYLQAYEVMVKKNSLSSKKRMMQEELMATNNGLAALYSLHAERALYTETRSFLHFYIWDILLFMFVGMAFYKTGILTGAVSAKTYWLLFILGTSIGLFLSWLRLQPIIHSAFDELETIKRSPVRFYETARVCRSLGFFGALMLLFKSGKMEGLFRLMRPLGQMALSNYLLQSVICGFIFYGIGLGLFGQIERAELYYVVAVIWIFQIWFSHIWLSYFFYGPFEWLWRRLSYGKNNLLKRKEFRIFNDT